MAVGGGAFALVRLPDGMVRALDAREAAQMPANEKKKRADAILINGGTREELDAELTALLLRWNVTV